MIPPLVWLEIKYFREDKQRGNANIFNQGKHLDWLQGLSLHILSLAYCRSTALHPHHHNAFPKPEILTSTPISHSYTLCNHDRIKDPTTVPHSFTLIIFFLSLTASHLNLTPPLALSSQIFLTFSFLHQVSCILAVAQTGEALWYKAPSQQGNSNPYSTTSNIHSCGLINPSSEVLEFCYFFLSQN